MSTASPDTAPITPWDRAVVIALGGAACALSYDALQQMAVTIHVRGILSYLFPVVIDGFIAYGVRALLVLRNSPLRARLYVWSLFGVATCASIWANAVHAVRLNQQTTAATGLRLDDMVVGALSALAPLALAGAVHLYILIARRPVNRGPRDANAFLRPEHISVSRADRTGRRHPVSDSPIDPVGEPRPSPRRQGPAARTAIGSRATPSGAYARPTTRPGHHRRPVVWSSLSGRPEATATGGQPPAAAEPVTHRGRSPAVRRGTASTEELLRIARAAVRAENKLTRRVVAQAIRGQRIPLSNDTLTSLMVQLRQQDGTPVTPHRD
ncbi:DUF2637 domain-containing protein [Streptomyces specialis]|uniref:DUF2637 domain-containing protein n=1 Tax=Streptomyces specialis TaxID=498367 RepID=UPI00073F0D5E|nr:DUF2637 domain-containing protein [Streptomyces specialis]